MQSHLPVVLLLQRCSIPETFIREMASPGSLQARGKERTHQ